MSETGHFGLHHCRAETLLADLPPGCLDAVVTDPPYSSGGRTIGERSKRPAQNYQQTGHQKEYPDFEGDTLDQRSWTNWMTDLFLAARVATRPAGYLLAFVDWRQLPAMTDAVQRAGWLWRGLISWDKGPGARGPHKGYFKHQCEYVVWATNGRCEVATHAGPFPGSYSMGIENVRTKVHMTQKPLALMRELVKIVPPGGLVCDPFAGSGSTLIAAGLEGRRWVGAELSAEYFDIARARIAAAATADQSGASE